MSKQAKLSVDPAGTAHSFCHSCATDRIAVSSLQQSLNIATRCTALRPALRYDCPCNTLDDHYGAAEPKASPPTIAP